MRLPALALASLLAAAPAAAVEDAAPAKGKAGRAPRAAPARPGKAPAGRGRIGSFAALQPAAAPPLTARQVGLRPSGESGQVRTVQGSRAWLGAGALDGLAPGQVLRLARKGEPAGQCTVEIVADRNGTCTGAGLRPGDTFAVSSRAAGSLPAQLPPRPGPEEQARRRAALERTALAPVDFQPARIAEPPERLRRGELALGHFSWLSSDAGPVHQERLDARVRGAEAWRGARLDLDLTAVARSLSPPSERFEPGRKAQLWVREASLSLAEPGARWRLAAGRVLPWLVPGGPTFDGLQAGWRPRAGAEVGLFGGAVPDPMTTAPGADSATGGGYWAVAGLAGGTPLRSEGRVAWVRLPGARNRLEAEATAGAWVSRRLDLSVQARLATGDAAAPGGLEAARADATWQTPGLFSLYAGYRYDDLRLPDAAAPALFPGRTRRAAGGVAWEGLGWLHLRAAAGHVRDVASGLSHGWAGPELAAPRLLGRWGGASAGYAEDLGSFSGRSAWLQGDLALGARTRLAARLTWTQEARGGPIPDDHAGGLSLAATSDLAAWLRLRLAALARTQLAQAEGATAGWGAALSASLEGRY